MMTACNSVNEKEYLGQTTVYGCTDRVKKLMKQMHDAPYGVCLHRARCFTEVYRENEDESHVIKKAMAVVKTLDTLPLLFNEGELIVGQRSTKLKSVPIHPEVETWWIMEEGGLEGLQTRHFSPCTSTPEEQREFREEIAPFWEKKTLMAKFRKTCPKDIQDKIIGTNFGEVSFALAVYGTHVHLRWPDIIKYGTKAYKEYAQKKLDEHDYYDLEERGKEQFYKSAIMVLEAMERFSKRWADYMRQLAAETDDEALKAEYLEIADICERVPYEPPQTFREALQAIWFVVCAFYNDSTGPLLAFGRMDQYLWPLYEKDIREGVITRDEAKELLQLFYIKTNNIFLFGDNDTAQHLAGNAAFQNVLVGGCDQFGNDASNDLSFLIVEAHIESHILQPALCVRVNKKSSDKFLLRTLDSVANGTGFPSYFNDDPCISVMTRYGNDLKDAYDYSCTGCEDIGRPGGFNWGPGQWVNFAAATELALSNGIRHDGLPGRMGGQRISVETGDPRDFKTFEDYMNAVKAHIAAQIDMVYIASQYIVASYQDYPLMVQSIFMENCLERGLPYHSGGARGSNTPGYSAVGMADIADACAAVKKLVYDDKVITMDQLVTAVDANFEGYEDIRQMCLACPKWGNDDDYVDLLEQEVIDFFTTYVLKKPGVFCKYDPDKQTASIRHKCGASTSPVSGNVPYGQGTWALTSGRKAGEPLGDAAGAYMGMDINGPTAAVRSYGKIDNNTISGGSTINLYIHKENLETPAAKRKVLDLLKGTFALGIEHIQFNVMDKEVLEDAQKNPDKYPTLMVRVSGYSAYFTELDEALQNAIMDRTQHNVG
jgi:formate C-acetyltransferase